MNRMEALTVCVIFIALVIMTGVMAYMAGQEIGYKDGQIDYHNKVIKYSLVTDSRGETTWAEVKK
jgi:hypothetical protein